MTLTRTQRSNLRKLADYLESLPDDYGHFEMRDFTTLNEGHERLIEYARHNGGVEKCGTVACAVGHGPAAGILFRAQDFRKSVSGRLYANWERYSARFANRDDHFEEEFDWAFGSPWSRVDNHHWGAAARIRYLLKHNGPPQGYGYGYEHEFRDFYRPFDKRHAQAVPA